MFEIFTAVRELTARGVEQQQFRFCVESVFRVVRLKINGRID